jgi:hypothetical protein
VCRIELLLAVLASLAAAGLHFVFLAHAGGFWRDEVNTLNLAASNSLGAMANDSFPILMPLLVRGWLALGGGGSDISLRCLGVVIGVGLLASFWLVAWEAKRSVPILSLALCGLNSTIIVYGDSLRAFGLGSLMAVVLVVAMGSYLRKPSWSRAVCLASIMVLCVKTLFQNVIFAGAICAGGWVVCWRRRSWAPAATILLIAFIAAFSLLPYLSTIARLSLTSPSSGIATLRTEFRLATVLHSLSIAAGFPLKQYVFAWGFFALVALAFAVMAWRTGSSASPARSEQDQVGDGQFLAATTLLAGIVGFAVFLWWAALQTQPWYFLPPMALAAACFELGLPPMRGPAYWSFLTFVALTTLLSVPACWTAVQTRFTNVDLVARRVGTEAATEDLIVVAPWTRGISFARYFVPQTPWQTVPPLEDHSTHRYDLLQKQTQSSSAMRPLFQQIAATLQHGHRVWVIGTMDLPLVPAAIPSYLDPPPLQHTGWSAGPYVRRWTTQAAQFIRNHSRRFVEIPMNISQAINPNEELGIWVAEGWEESEPAFDTQKPKP